MHNMWQQQSYLFRKKEIPFLVFCTIRYTIIPEVGLQESCRGTFDKDM